MDIRTTSCCALGQLCAGNDLDLQDFTQLISELRSDTKKNYLAATHNGWSAIFCVTTSNEDELAGKLKQFGFKEQFKFSRRNGYPLPTKNSLTYWQLDLTD